eukprot:s582_g20.t1
MDPYELLSMPRDCAGCHLGVVQLGYVFNQLKSRFHARDASPRSIEKAWRQKALQVHPDKANADLKKEAEEQFKKLLEARDMLMNPQRRQNQKKSRFGMSQEMQSWMQEMRARRREAKRRRNAENRRVQEEETSTTPLLLEDGIMEEEAPKTPSSRAASTAPPSSPEELTQESPSVEELVPEVKVAEIPVPMQEEIIHVPKNVTYLHSLLPVEVIEVPVPMQEEVVHVPKILTQRWVQHVEEVVEEQPANHVRAEDLSKKEVEAQQSWFPDFCAFFGCCAGNRRSWV